jgi:translation initiation factor IF-1
VGEHTIRVTASVGVAKEVLEKSAVQRRDPLTCESTGAENPSAKFALGEKLSNAADIAHAYEAEGEVIEVLRGGHYRIRIDGADHTLLARCCGKMIRANIKIVLGDRVRCELTP